MAFSKTWVCDLNGCVVGVLPVLKMKLAVSFLTLLVTGRGQGRAMVDKAFVEKGPLTVEVLSNMQSLHEASGHVTVCTAHTP